VKKIFLFTILLTSIFADIKANKESIIINSSQRTATIKDIDVPVGSSGIVIHYFDKEHSTVVARAELIKKNKIAYRLFDTLKQENLPTPKILPKNGDKVILNYLYDRGLIIAPNYKTYKNIINNYNEIEWLHPDLFAAELSREKNPAPTKKILKIFAISML